MQIHRLRHLNLTLTSKLMIAFNVRQKSLGMYNSNICLDHKKNRLFDHADATLRQPSNQEPVQNHFGYPHVK